MTGFHFSLERVLHWRSLVLASEEAKLRRLIEDEALLESKLNGIRKAVAEIPLLIAALDEIRGNDLNRIAAYRIRLMIEDDRISALCRDKRRAIAEQAEIHRQAKQRHRLLEELRRRRRDEWNVRMLRELDELAHESYLSRWRPV